MGSGKFRYALGCLGKQKLTEVVEFYYNIQVSIVTSTYKEYSIEESKEHLRRSNFFALHLP